MRPSAKNFLVSFGSYLLTFLIGSIFLLKFLGLDILILLSILISGVIIYFLSRRANPLSLTITIILIIYNMSLLVFKLIPTYDQEISTEGFYNQQQNYISIQINDSLEDLEEKRVKIYITNPNSIEKRVINLYSENIFNAYKSGDADIMLNEGDTIMFFAKENTIKTIVNLYLWDGTIIRVLPQSTVKLAQLLKDSENLIDSKTNVEVQKGNIWFNLIRTIVSDDGFNVKTKNGTLVIRGTSGLVGAGQSGNELVAYSNDHIIEIKDNEGNSKLIQKGEAVNLGQNGFEEISLSSLQSVIDENIVSFVGRLSSIDDQEIAEYKENLVEYIEENFNWSLNENNFIEKLSIFKMSAMGLFNQGDYKEKLENLNKFKLLIGNSTGLDINKIKTDLDGLLITPVSNKMKDLKLEFLKQRGVIDTEIIKSYIINTYGKLIDEGKNIDLEKVEYLLENIKDNSIFDKVQNYYKSIIE